MCMDNQANSITGYKYIQMYRNYLLQSYVPYYFQLLTSQRQQQPAGAVKQRAEDTLYTPPPVPKRRNSLSHRDSLLQRSRCYSDTSYRSVTEHSATTEGGDNVGNELKNAARVNERPHTAVQWAPSIIGDFKPPFPKKSRGILRSSSFSTSPRGPHTANASSGPLPRRPPVGGSARFDRGMNPAFRRG